MKNKLRFLALLLCLCQILCLIGCGGESTTTPTEPAPTQPETTNPVPQNGTAEDWWNFFFNS